ncbi:unnamed protein product [Protopolystoma xenopodis]|uniref:Uncharacterized protein n=1 Tax=Protopolystoma xenopodis TaxID=117903 RepID=A0A3S5CPN8_9PLAT|nr:unnamed protein product [Protopolystoma xenopodis]
MSGDSDLGAIRDSEIDRIYAEHLLHAVEVYGRQFGGIALLASASSPDLLLERSACRSIFMRQLLVSLPSPINRFCLLAHLATHLVSERGSDNENLFGAREDRNCRHKDNIQTQKLTDGNEKVFEDANMKESTPKLEDNDSNHDQDIVPRLLYAGWEQQEIEKLRMFAANLHSFTPRSLHHSASIVCPLFLFYSTHSIIL